MMDGSAPRMQQIPDRRGLDMVHAGGKSGGHHILRKGWSVAADVPMVRSVSLLERLRHIDTASLSDANKALRVLPAGIRPLVTRPARWSVAP